MTPNRVCNFQLFCTYNNGNCFSKLRAFDDASEMAITYIFSLEGSKLIASHETENGDGTKSNSGNGEIQR
ncbi:hypothetical protein L1987_84004 [Smallanthus sonchifolius]|uniref:Uncharacterized protein n=1 Tax=Smallanthus sonchifolius TaxID=185202 RepID=A0ACB8YCR4_9ASTR|nr:hypothetical protein L1987_84004 [Smallanthus sonchifolius]